MAEIHFSVSSDYKEVIRLRKECEKLEAQLKKMDVNKHPDVAKSLEKQLEKATRKIREYQEKYAKLKKVQDDIGKSNNTTDDVKKSTAALQSTNKWIEANTKAIIEADNQIKIFKKDFDSLSADDKAGSAGTAKLRQIEQVVAKRMAEAESIRKTIKVQKDKIIQDRAEEGSITQLRKQLSLLIVDYDNMGRLRREGGAGKALLAQIKVVQDELNKAEQASGRFQRNVGNYSSAFNGLGMSIQQIARELPTLSMGANMFFLAISNNLPIFFDEVQRARKEYTAYIAELKKGNTDVQKVAPVWKQIASGIFSWNTALTVGVTLLTVYGKDIVEWVKELINGKEAVDALKEAQKQLNEAQLEGSKNAQSELLKLRLLRKEAEDTTKPIEQRKKAVSELQRLYPDYLGNIDKEKILTGQVAGMYKTLANDILSAAKARATFDKLVESAKKEEELKDVWASVVASNANVWKNLGYDDMEALKNNIDKIRELRKSTERESGAKYGNAAGGFLYDLGSKGSKDEQAIDEIIKAYDAWQAKIKETEEIAKGINVSDFISNPNSNDLEKAEQERELLLKIQQKIADELLKLQATNQQREIDLMKEGTEKKIAQINLDYKVQIETIKKQADEWAKEQGGTLSAQQTMQVSIAYSLAKKTRERDTTEVFQKQIEEENKAMNDYLKEYGDYQEKRLAITEEYNQKIAQATTEGEKLSLRKGLESAIKELDFSQFKTSINFADIFGNLDAQTTSSLTSLRDKLQEYINQAAKDLKPDDLKELQDAFSNINLKIADRQPFKELKSGLEDYKAAQEAVSLAQQDLDKVMSGGEVIVGLYSDETGQLVKKLLTQEQAEKNLSKAQSDRQKTLATLNQSLNSIGDNGKKVVDGVNSLTGMLADLGVNVSEDVSKSVDGIGQVFEGLANIDLTKPGSIITSSMKIVGGLGKTIGGLFGGKSKAERDAERLAKVTDKIAQTNEVINNLIDKRVDLIKEATAAEREGLKESSLDIIERQRKMMEAQFQKLLGNELLGKKGKNNDLDVKDLGISSIEDLANFLTSDKLVELMENGYGITDKDKWYGIVEEWEKLNDQADKLKETVSEINTGITFDEARDGLDDLLLSADTTFRDISDNFEGYMRKSVLNVVKSRYLNDEMQKWYDQFEQRTADEVLSDEDVNFLRQQYESMYKEAQNKVNGMLAAAGVGLEGASSSQESSKKGFATASQDQIEELNGRFTAGQIAWEETKNQAVMQTEKLSILNIKTESLVNVASDQRNIADETRTILANSYLELQQINENTGAIIKPITEMRDKMNSWDSKIRNM